MSHTNPKPLGFGAWKCGLGRRSKCIDVKANLSGNNLDVVCL